MGQGAVQTGKHSGDKQKGKGRFFALNPQMGAIQPLQAHAGDKVKAPSGKEHPQVGRKGEWEQLQIMKEISPLQQEGDHQGPGGTLDRCPVYPPPQQGVEEIALEEDGDEIEMGRPLAGEQFPQQPGRVSQLAAPSVQVKACVGEGIEQNPPEVRGQHTGAAGPQEGQVGDLSARLLQREAGEKEKEGNAEPGGLVEEKGQIHPQEEVAGLIGEVGAADVDADDGQHGDEPEKVNFQQPGCPSGPAACFAQGRGGLRGGRRGRPRGGGVPPFSLFSCVKNGNDHDMCVIERKESGLPGACPLCW